MWMGPLLYVVTSIFLWKYLGVVFMPVLLTRTLTSMIPALAEFEMLITINANAFYFGAYFLFGFYWPRLKSYFRNPFLAGMALWAVNVFVLLPLIGRGVLGYRLPQGWMAVSFPLLLSHWLFARGLSHQVRS
jgi:hypothetical protein